MSKNKNKKAHMSLSFGVYVNDLTESEEQMSCQSDLLPATVSKSSQLGSLT